MEEEAKKSPELQMYYKLFSIQNRISAIPKGASNPFFDSTYADLNSIMGALKPFLEEMNLIIIQPPVFENGRTVLRTILIDVETGYSINAGMALPELTDPQKIGSSMTYFKRNSLKSFFFLQDAEDDGETGAGRGKVELQEKKDKWKEEISKIETVQGLADFLKKNKENEKHLLTMLGKRRKEIESK